MGIVAHNIGMALALNVYKIRAKALLDFVLCPGLKAGVNICSIQTIYSISYRNIIYKIHPASYQSCPLKQQIQACRI